MPWLLRAIPALALLGALLACSTTGDGYDPFACETQADCTERETCVARRCEQLRQPTDAGLLPDATLPGPICTPYSTGPIVLDALAQCSAETLGAFTVAENIPAGDYVVRALPSGFSAWAPPWAPPRTGWLYQIPCLEIDVSARDRVRTPQGAAYATAEEAFSGIISKTATTSFPGGALHCGFRDTQCADNSGTLRFQLDRSCP